MSFPSDMEIIQLQEMASPLLTQNWLGQDLWSLQWWLLLATLIIPWFIWFRLADRRRIFELLTFGLMAVIITTYVDALGVNFGLFLFPFKLIPAAVLSPISVGFIPVVFMLVYHYSPNWISFLVNSTLVFAAAAFLLEPLAKYLGMYEMLEWNYLYSFLVYLGTAVVLRAIIMGFRSMRAKQKSVEPEESKRLIAAPALKRQEE